MTEYTFSAIIKQNYLGVKNEYILPRVYSFLLKIMYDKIKKLVENQNKIVAKIQEMDLLISALNMSNTQLVKENEQLRNRIGGIETILVEKCEVTKDAIELHKSFDDKKLHDAITTGGETEKKLGEQSSLI